MDSALPDSFAGQRVSYELTQIVPLILMVGLGLLFYYWGAKTRADQVDVPLDAEAVEALVLRQQP